MSLRRFRPGDRVQHRNGGPIMEVLHYILDYNPWIGNFLSSDQLECVWSEKGELKSKVFRQDVLTLTSPSVVLAKEEKDLLRNLQ